MTASLLIPAFLSVLAAAWSEGAFREKRYVDWLLLGACSLIQAAICVINVVIPP